MAVTLETTKRRIRKRLNGTTRYVYRMRGELARVQGRIDSGHYAARTVEGELVPERDRLQLTVDEERAYAWRDCMNIVEQYRERTGDHENADDLAEGVADFIEHQMGERQALDLLPLYFDDGNANG